MTITLNAPAPAVYKISVTGEKGPPGPPGDGTSTIGDVTGLQAALDGKAASSHTHATTDITGLGTMATQNASGVTINGGSLFNVSITGLGTPSGPTDAVNKSYVDTLNATGMKAPHAVLDCSTNPNYPAAATAGMQWVISVAGKIGGASGKSVEVDDVIQSLAANAGGTQAAVGTSWHITQGNIVGALLSSQNLADISDGPTALANIGGQPIDATTTAFAALPIAADKLPYGTGTDTFALTDFTAFMRTLLDDPNQSTALATLGAQGASSTLTSLATVAVPTVSGSWYVWNGGWVIGASQVYGRSLLNTANVASAQSILQLVPGTNVLAPNGNGSALSGITQSQIANLSTDLTALRVETLTIHYEAPTVKTYTLDAKAEYAYTINMLKGLKTTSGTATVTVKINGTAVTGLTNLSVTSTTQDATASAANTVAAGAIVTLEFTAVSSPVDFVCNMKATRT